MVWIENMGEIFHDLKDYGNFQWTVPNLYIVPSNSIRDYIVSPWFSFEENKWRLALIPNKKEPTAETHVGLFLWRKCSKCPNVQFHVNLGLKCAKKSFASYKSLYELETQEDEDIGVFDFLPVLYFSKYRTEISTTGNLKIRCEMTKIEDDDDDSDDSDTSEDTSSEDPVENEKKIEVEAKGFDRLCQNFEKMFVEGLNSDFILKVENSEFPVHRCVLSARSTVFATMFQQDMSEKSSNAVDIPDCPAESFKIFLRYLYTGRVDDISSENVLNVFYAADKYAVSDLKEDCVAFMKDKLSVATFCDVIALSLRHCESELRKAATQFFCDNIKKIINTVQWQNYMRENTIHANELLIKALNA